MRGCVEGSLDDFSDDDDFCLHASERSLSLIWDNPDDDVYGELLERNDDPVKQ